MGMVRAPGVPPEPFREVGVVRTSCSSCHSVSRMDDDAMKDSGVGGRVAGRIVTRSFRVSLT
jgi:hypothetical protein